jgi:hypothetical protein
MQAEQLLRLNKRIRFLIETSKRKKRKILNCIKLLQQMISFLSRVRLRPKLSFQTVYKLVSRPLSRTLEM